MNKKYLPSALILYLNYFIHGVGCSILGQAVIKEALATAWGVEAMAITAISAALGLGRLIALPFAKFCAQFSHNWKVPVQVNPIRIIATDSKEK